MANKIADKDYYRDAEGNLVDESDETAAFLVVRAGQEITPEMEKKYGIGKGKSVETATEEKVSVPTENKAVQPANNKGAKKK